MFALLFVLILAASLTGELNAWAAPWQSDQPGPAGSVVEVEGSVVDGQGRPVPFASLVLQQSNFSRAIVADQDGRFQFHRVPNGRYRIEAQADGYQSGSEQLDTGLGGRQPRLILSLPRKDDPEEARAAGERVVTVQTLGVPGGARKEYEKGLERFSRGQYEAALERFDAALRKHREFSAARAWRGLTLLRLGRPEAAYIDLAESLRLDPAAYDANLGLGMACNDLGRFAESKEHLLRAQAAQPGQWATELELGRAYYGLRLYEEAEQRLRKAVDIGAKEPSVYLVLANVSIKQKKQDEALAALREYLRMAPQGPQGNEIRRLMRLLGAHDPPSEASAPAE